MIKLITLEDDIIYAHTDSVCRLLNEVFPGGYERFYVYLLEGVNPVLKVEVTEESFNLALEAFKKWRD